jgi:hypothetical protein
MRDKKTGNAVDLGKRLGRRQACAQVAGRWRGGRCRMLAPALPLQARPRVGIGSVSGNAVLRTNTLGFAVGTSSPGEMGFADTVPVLLAAARGSAAVGERGKNRSLTVAAQ